MANSIKSEISCYLDEMIQIRRDFHRHPELAMEETRTAEIVSTRLSDLGLKVTTGIGKTGVVGLLEGSSPGKTLMLRADMDALPIKEKNKIDYKSINNGLMHACGHDGHMAILLTVAKILTTKKNKFSGRIKFVFQPGEEGAAGARLMVEDGVLTKPEVDAVFGLHLNTSFDTNIVALGAGPMMACMDSFTIKVIGKGGHAAMPEQGKDAIFMSAQVISALQSLISKEVSPLTPLIVHIGEVHGGRAFNIVADEVDLHGTVRTHDEILRKSLPKRIDRIVNGITAALRGTHELSYQFVYPPVVNDSTMTELVKAVAAQVVGDEHVLEISPNMVSDDIAFFLEQVPGCYFFVGARNAEKGFNKAHHEALFNFDEGALAIGAEIMVRLALSYLKIN